MQTFDYTFVAGETKVLPSGKFFMILSATYSLDVNFLKRESSIDEKAVGVESGFWVEFPEKFDSVRVTSATAQTCRLATSDGKGGLNTTSTSILGVVDANIISSVDLNIIDLDRSAEIYSGHSGSSAAVQTLLSGVANSNGAVILSAIVSPYTTVNPNNGRIFVDSLGTGIGGSVSNPLHLTLATCMLNPTTSSDIVGGVGLPIKIPAGHSIHYVQSLALTGLTASIAYKLLP